MKIKIAMMMSCLFLISCVHQPPKMILCKSTHYYPICEQDNMIHPGQQYLYVVNYFPCKPCDNYHECIDHVDKCSCEDLPVENICSRVSSRSCIK